MPSPQITITGNLENLLGQLDSGGSVVFTLVGYGPSDVPRVATAGVIVLPTVTALAPAGSFSVTLWGNDVITPANTFYQVDFFADTGAKLQTVLYQFTGSGSIDLSNVAPLNTLPTPSPITAPPNAVLTNPTAGQTISGQPLTVTSTITASGFITVGNVSAGSLTVSGNGTVSGALMVQSVNGVLQVGNGPGQYSSMAACYAALPATGGTCMVTPGWTETFSSNLVLSKNNAGFLFMGPAQITLGSNQITCANGALTGGFIEGRSPLGGFNQSGFGSGATWSFGGNSTYFKYTGSGAAISCGDNSAAKTGMKLENFGLDLSAAGSSAIGIDVINWQLGGWIRGIGLNGLASSNTQVGIQVDNGGGTDSFDWSIENNQVMNFNSAIVLNGIAQEIQLIGNQLQCNPAVVTCATGLTNGGIGIEWHSGNIQGFTTAIAFTGSAAEFEGSVIAGNGGTSPIFSFGASTSNNHVRYLGTTVPTYTNNGASSNIVDWGAIRYGGYSISVSGSDFVTTSTVFITITGLQWVFPATQAPHVYNYTCDFIYSIATAAAAVTFSLSASVNLPVQTAAAFMATSNAQPSNINAAGAALLNSSSFAIIAGTPAVIATPYPIHIAGSLTIPAAGATVSWNVKTANSSDAVTVSQGSACSILQ